MKITVPRKFRLIEELDNGEKNPSLDISWGLADRNDSSLTNWVGSIFGPQKTPYQQNIYQLTITCGENYPQQPPVVRFKTRINMDIVLNDGSINTSVFTKLGKDWKEDYTIQTILSAIRDQMCSPSNRNLAQPRDGTYF